jgi:branched-chain amino acid transport system substrate-binding protein
MGSWAIESANKDGGVNGREIKVTVLDDGNDPARAVSNATSLITSKKVLAVTGSVAADPCKAMLPIAESHKTPLISASGSEDVLSSDYGFISQAGGDSMARPMYEYAKELAGNDTPRVGIVALTTGAIAAWRGHTSKIADSEGSESHIEDVDPTNANVLQQMQEIAKFKPEVVLLEDTEPHYVQLLQAMDAAGLSLA